MSDSDWDDEYYPNLPRPRFRSPLRHAQRLKKEKSEDAGKPQKRFPAIKVLHVGHSTKFEHTGDVFESCSVTLIKGCKFNILVDSMNAWDGCKLENLLLANGVHPDDVHYVVCTDSNPFRTGCNYLFRGAFHIVGDKMHHGERHIGTPLDHGGEFLIEPKVKVMCTPGKTPDGVSVLVTSDIGVVAVTGDLFEREEDITDPTIWKKGSLNVEQQEQSRRKIIGLADHIIPGRGPKFHNSYKALY